MKNRDKGMRFILMSGLLLLLTFSSSLCAQAENFKAAGLVRAPLFGVLTGGRLTPAEISIDQGKGLEKFRWSLLTTEFRDEKEQKISWSTFLNTYKGKGVGLEFSPDGMVLKAFPSAF